MGVPVSKYKVTYFNIRGRAEPSRMLFAVANVPFEDERVDFKDWPAMKSKMPLETLPVLYVNDEIKSSQSMSIARYLAREFNLFGKNKEETHLINEIIETAVDFVSKGTPAFQENDPAKKRELFEKLKADTYPKYLEYLENLIKKGGKDDFAVGSSISLADVVILAFLENMKCDEKDLAKFPRVKANYQKTMTNERIANYLKTRIETPM